MDHDIKSSILSSFLEITTEQSVKTAKQFLDATTWKLDEAVQLFFLNRAVDEVPSSGCSSSSSIEEEEEELDDEMLLALAASMEGLMKDDDASTSTNIGEEPPMMYEESSSSNEEEDNCLMEEKKKITYPALPEEPQTADKNLVCRVGFRLPQDGRRVQRSFLRTDPIQLLWSFISSQFEEVERNRPFRLTMPQGIIGTASKALDYESKVSLEESGLSNSIILVTWND